MCFLWGDDEEEEEDDVDDGYVDGDSDGDGDDDDDGDDDEEEEGEGKASDYLLVFLPTNISVSMLHARNLLVFEVRQGGFLGSGDVEVLVDTNAKKARTSSVSQAH